MEAIHQTEESQQDMLHLIEARASTENFLWGQTNFFATFPGRGGKKAEKLAKFDKLVNFKAIFGTISLKVPAEPMESRSKGVVKKKPKTRQ